jgi:hypothetical protein
MTLIYIGYTGKAKSWIGGWVPIVSIHSPLSVFKFLQRKKNMRVCKRGRRGGGRPRAIEWGSESATMM